MVGLGPIAKKVIQRFIYLKLYLLSSGAPITSIFKGPHTLRPSPFGLQHSWCHEPTAARDSRASALGPLLVLFVIKRQIKVMKRRAYPVYSGYPPAGQRYTPAFALSCA